MIDAILSTAIQWFNVLISFFPDANLNIVDQINSFMSNFRNGMAIMDNIIPVSMFMWAMALILTIETALFTFKVWRWIASNVSLGIFK